MLKCNYVHVRLQSSNETIAHVQVQINKQTSKHEEGRQKTSNFLSWLKMQMIDQPKASDTNTDKDDMHIH